MVSFSSEREQFAALRLFRSENVGVKTFFELTRVFGCAQTALERAPEMARRAGRRKALRICDAATARQEQETLEKAGGRFVFFGEEAYPALLKHIPDPPPLFSFLGREALLQEKCVALVGARNASANGLAFTATLSRALSEAGYCIVSGMARGTDGAAHEAAQEMNTIAVLAGGINHTYPPEHKQLHRRLAREGGLIAEMPWGAVPKAQHFPRRNRIISGLCPVTVIIEAGLRSGSLITAKRALEQGRTVGAVPGSPLDARCAGANMLLKQGAPVITCADDVLEMLAGEERSSLLKEPAPPPFAFSEPQEIALSARPPAEEESAETDNARDALIRCLSAAPTDIDTAAAQAGLHPSQAARAALELELAGRIERCGGGAISLVF